MQPNNEPAGNWGFHPENGAQQSDPNNTAYQEPQQKQPAQQSVTWTASEFIANHKDSSWYLGVVAAGAMLGVLVYLITKDLMSAGAIVVVLILFAVISSHKPRQLTYEVNQHGIGIGDKFYPYNLFKSFAIMQDGAISSINLVPLKRFMPEIAIYYAPADEPKIIEILVNSLPNDQKGERLTDRFMKKIRF